MTVFIVLVLMPEVRDQWPLAARHLQRLGRPDDIKTSTFIIIIIIIIAILAQGDLQIDPPSLWLAR